MRCTIFYASNSGSTFFASEHLKNELIRRNISCHIYNMEDFSEELMKNTDLIIFGTNTWNYDGKEGMPHTFYLQNEKVLKTHDYKNLPVAIFALGDMSYLQFCGSADYLTSLFSLTNCRMILQALKINGYLRDEKKNKILLERWLSNLLTTISPSAK